MNFVVMLAMDGMTTWILQNIGTRAGMIACSGSVSDSTAYVPIIAMPYGGGLRGPSVEITTVIGQWEIAVGALTHLQARMTAYTSGSASVLFAAANGSKIARVRAPANDPQPVFERGNAGYSTATVLTAGGSAAAAARSVRVNCTAAGTITLNLADDCSNNLPIALGWQTFPFAATGFAFADTGAGSFFNLD